MFLVIFLYALFGLTFTVGKIILFYCKPFFMVMCRMIIGGIGLLAYYYYTKHTQTKLRWKDWPYFLQVGLFGIFLPYCLRGWGLVYVSSTKAAFIFALMPLATALMSYYFKEERLNGQQYAGLAVGFLGMIPTFLTSSTLEDLSGGIGFFSWPELAIFGAMLCFAYNLIALQILVKERGVPAPLANGICMFTSGILAGFISFKVEDPMIIGNVNTLILLLIAQIIASNFICSTLQATLLKKYSPTFMAFASFLAPLCAAFYGWLLLDETIYVSFLLSLMMVLAGFVIFTVGERRSNQS